MRDSPEDQATLEAAYQRNPKPDRATRMRIVEQVALGEKEVQVLYISLWTAGLHRKFHRAHLLTCDVFALDMVSEPKAEYAPEDTAG